MADLILLIVIGSSIWVYFDAKSIGVKKGQVAGLANMSPGGWFFVTLFLWIIGFPLYLSKRGDFKRANTAVAEFRKCPQCAEEIRVEAVKCRFCGADVEPLPVEVRPALAPSKPRNRAGTIIIGTIVGLVALAFLIQMADVASVSDQSGGGSSSSRTAPATSTAAPGAAGAAAANATATSSGSATSGNLTAAQRNAVRSANSYLQLSGFSRQGLIDQLSSEYGEKFSVGDATVAVDSLSIDWNTQAARSAASYLKLSGFSCQGLIDQLSSAHGDKYTVEQATHGATQAGIC
jgi:hypothetical protein